MFHKSVDGDGVSSLTLQSYYTTTGGCGSQHCDLGAVLFGFYWFGWLLEPRQLSGAHSFQHTACT